MLDLFLFLYQQKIKLNPQKENIEEKKPSQDFGRFRSLASPNTSAGDEEIGARKDKDKVSDRLPPSPSPSPSPLPLPAHSSSADFSRPSNFPVIASREKFMIPDLLHGINLLCVHCTFWAENDRVLRELKVVWLKPEQLFPEQSGHGTLHLTRRGVSFPEDPCTEIITLFTS
ncbi:hypothetical protein OIU85_012269 [Salix viminalis]|uniref:Uncharacterized protein n=1 Tax=Salix viminalis TaxID=40686 RepID=A0A9Q0NNZ0_SALVM|nr:hypothetical protein OIU85_012269 [Salix viminalis]